MAIFRPAMMAAVLAVSMTAAPIAAHAANAAVVVVDVDRIYKESNVGKYAQGQLKTIASGVDAELGPIARTLQTDEEAFNAKVQGKSEAQVKAALASDKDLAAKYMAIMQRRQAFDDKRALRTQELSATNQKALADVGAKAQPVVVEIMKKKGASIVLEKNSTVANSADVDITNDVLTELNKSVQSIPIAKVDLSKQAH
jgi:Skp family chaperone for outer membrane proteins